MNDQFGKHDFYLNADGKYKNVSEKNLRSEIDRLLNMWQSFLIAQNASDLQMNKDYFIHSRNMYEVISRRNKRRAYYYVFHGINRICEYKEVAILAYWIITLKPFMVVNENSPLYNSPNEMFALYLILSCLAEVYERVDSNQQFTVPDNKTIADYVYNFKYCDLSREAMIFFVETLAKSYGIGMETRATLDERK